ncbi:MAG: hypothetical protein OXF80_07675, partial [Cyanobacteria bacterium MAG COS1_bin_9]|nr:hypothetical protein [Cyanobacteria bacterium MAG COS1_bin_9]
MSRSPVRWYIKAQLGVLLLPVGLCLFGEAVSRKVVQMLGKDAGPWFWYGTLSLICINAGTDDAAMRRFLEVRQETQD